MTVVDVLSGYVVLRALLSKTMAEVVRCLWVIICEYGTMKVLQSDNGTEFVNHLMQQFTQMYGIDHRLVTPYNPVAQGQPERVNKEVKRGMKKVVQSVMEKWHLCCHRYS